MNIEVNNAELQMLISAIRNRVKSLLISQQKESKEFTSKEKTEERIQKTVDLYNKLQLVWIKSEIKPSDDEIDVEEIWNTINTEEKG